MAAKDVKVLANLGLHGSLRFSEALAEFPVNPSIGDICLKGTELFAYIKIGDFETWYPFANKTNAYIHTQGVSSSLWTVNHNLGTTDIWTQIRDTNNNIVNAGLINITANSFQIQFTEAILGTVIVVAPDSLDVPSVTTSSITVGNVSITGSNITIDGNQVLTAGGTGSFATVATTGSFNDLVDKPTTIVGYGITDAQPLDADLTAIAALAGTGFLKRTGVDAWTLDTNSYITGNQTITVSGDASGSGTTSISLILANTGVSAGTYKSVTVDAKGRVTAGTNPTTLAGYGITDAVQASHIGSGGSAHANATTSTSGFMSAADKTKLDSIDPGASNYTLPVATSTVLGGVKDGAGVTIDVDGTINANVLSVAGKTGAVTLTNSDVGLGNVENKSSATIRSELTSLNVTTALGFTPENLANKNAVNGYAGLDSNGKISSTQLPAIAITDTFVVASQAAMLSLIAETGDVAVRTDLNKSFILKGASASTLGDWQELLTPTDSVSSVNGMTGVVTISTISGNAGTATTLETARTISTTGDASWSVSFDGSANVSSALTLANSGVTAGTYNNVSTEVRPFTVDAKGRITSIGTAVTITPAFSSITGKPTTLAGYGITDAAPLSHVSDASLHLTSSQNTWIDAITATSAEVNYLVGVTSSIQTQLNNKQPLDADLTAIAALAGTSGFLKKTAADTWTLDTNTYLTSTSTLDASKLSGTIPSLVLGNSTLYIGTTAVALNRASGSMSLSGITTVGLTYAGMTSDILTTSTTTANQVVASYSASVYRSAKFQIQVVSGTSYHVTEIMVMHDGTTAYINEYGTMFTGASLATFDADVSGGNMRLLVTPTNASTVIKFKVTLITA